MKREGFWRDARLAEWVSPWLLARGTQLPWPEESPEPVDAAWLEKLVRVQQSATVKHYMGLSMCRLCGERNGSREFELGGWVWPEGLAHYYRDHAVHPSPKFRAFVDARFEL
jgi:hypothetical protein